MENEAKNVNANYEAVLADLEAKRAAIDNAITVIKQVIGMAVDLPAGVPAGEPLNKRTFKPDEIPSDAFFNMSVGDATRKYLSMVRQTRSTKDIVETLERGGLTHTSKNFYGTVHTALLRREKEPGDLIRVKRKWGLSEWYPGARKSKKGNATLAENGKD